MRPRKCGPDSPHCDCGTTGSKCKYRRPWVRTAAPAKTKKSKADKKALKAKRKKGRR